MPRITITNESTGRGVELTPNQFEAFQQALIDARDYRLDDLDSCDEAGDTEDAARISDQLGVYSLLNDKLIYIATGELTQ